MSRHWLVGFSGTRQNLVPENKKQPEKNGCWKKSLCGKWLEINKHPFKTGCLEFQVLIEFRTSSLETNLAYGDFTGHQVPD